MGQCFPVKSIVSFNSVQYFENEGLKCAKVRLAWDPTLISSTFDRGSFDSNPDGNFKLHAQADACRSSCYHWHVPTVIANILLILSEHWKLIFCPLRTHEHGP
jgi:hypothetical protein